MPNQNLVKLILKNLVKDQKCEDNGDDAIIENANMKSKIIYANSIWEWLAKLITSYFKLQKADVNEIIKEFQNIISRKQKFDSKVNNNIFLK